MNGSFLLQNQSASFSSKLFKLEAGIYFVGRSLACDLVLFDETVSRRHAEIMVAEGCVSVKDLDSRNGTFLDDIRITDGVLSPGHYLRFGDVTFILTQPGVDGEKFRTEEETASCADQGEDLVLDPSQFSAAQGRVLNLLVNGFAEKEIAGRLHLSQHTVHNHVRRIYEIVQVHSRAELLVRLIRKNGS